MFNSQSKESNLVFAIYKDIRSVFRQSDIALLLGEVNAVSLNKKLNYFVHTGKLLNPRKGIYAKMEFNQEELACRLFTPSYISLEYVLQKAGVIFQYSSAISSVSYLSREVCIGNTDLTFRKIKGEIMVDTIGIIRQPNGINIATPERALLDMLYLNSSCHFDNLNSIDKEHVLKILPIYNSAKLKQRITKLFEENGYK
jgi:hypothetical protein